METAVTWFFYGIAALLALRFGLPLIGWLLYGALCLMSLLISWPISILHGLIFYLSNMEIFSRQNEMEGWLAEEFKASGITVTFMRQEQYGFCDFVGAKEVLDNSNLFFHATVPSEQVEEYKRILGVVCNKFPWVKISDRSFGPYRCLDKAWAEKFRIEACRTRDFDFNTLERERRHYNV